MKNATYILRIKCPDAYGIVAKVSTSLNDMDIFIMDSSFFSDPETKVFHEIKNILKQRRD